MVPVSSSLLGRSVALHQHRNAEFSSTSGHQHALLSRGTVHDEHCAAVAVAAGGSWLRSEVLALTQDTAPEQQQAAEPEQQQDAAGSSSSSTAEAAAAAQRAARLTAAASRQHAGGAAAGGGKMPKWFKK